MLKIDVVVSSTDMLPERAAALDTDFATVSFQEHYVPSSMNNIPTHRSENPMGAMQHVFEIRPNGKVMEPF